MDHSLIFINSYLNKSAKDLLYPKYSATNTMARPFFMFALVISLAIPTLQTDQTLITIPVKRQSTNPPNFAVSVDLGDQYSTMIPQLSNPKMIVVISLNETVLTANLSYYNQYACVSPCSFNQADVANIGWPYDQTGVLYPAYNVSASLPNSTWSLNSSTAVLSSSLYPYPESDSYMGYFKTFGWIGLGTEGGAFNNYQGDHPLFSISISGDEDISLIFGNDTTKANSSSLVGFYNADANWRMNVIAVSFNGASLLTSNSSSNPMVFDLQYQTAFVLPSAVQSSLEAAIISLGGYKAFDTLYISKISQLLDLVLTLYDGSQLSIPAYIYMKSVPEDNSYEPNYLFHESGDLYDDHIILGYSALSMFYSVFERVNDTSIIGLYSAKAPLVTSPSGSALKTIVIILIFIAVIGVGFFIYRRYQKKKVAALEASLLLESPTNSAE